MDDVTWQQRLFERGVKAVLERVRQRPSYQERERRRSLANPIVTVARLLAASPADDETLARRLTARINPPEAAGFALDELERTRTEFVDERAYRILYAAANGTSVAPADRESVEGLRAQEQLGRLPLRDAFSLLADLAPGLQALESQIVDVDRRRNLDDSDLDAEIVDRSQEILGAGSSSNPLLGTVLASMVAQQYLRLIAGTQPLGDLDSPILGREDLKI